MTIATRIQKLSIAAASASVLAIAAHAAPAEAALRLFNFASNYEGYPITGSFTIDDATPGTTIGSPLFDISYYSQAISQAEVTAYGELFEFQDIDFYVGNDLAGPDSLDAIAFSQGPIEDLFGGNFVGVLFPGFQFASSSLKEALDALDGASGFAVAPYLAEDVVANLGDLEQYKVYFSEEKNTESVPEPASLVGLLGLGAWGAGSALKRKQRSQHL